MKKTLYYVLPLFGYGIKGEVESIDQLHTKFLNWCGTIDLIDSESYALLLADGEKKVYNMPAGNAVTIAKEVFKKLPPQEKGEWLDLTDQT